MKLPCYLLGIGNPVAYYPGLRLILGDTKDAIFVCQFYYWQGKGSDPNGWIYKTANELQKETGLTYKEQRRVRRRLKKLGILSERYARSEHLMYFKFNWEKLLELWRHMTDGQVPYDQRSDATLPEVNSLIGNTKNTRENTSYTGEDTNGKDTPISISIPSKVEEQELYKAASG